MMGSAHKGDQVRFEVIDFLREFHFYTAIKPRKTNDEISKKSPKNLILGTFLSQICSILFYFYKYYI